MDRSKSDADTVTPLNAAPDAAAQSHNQSPQESPHESQPGRDAGSGSSAEGGPEEKRRRGIYLLPNLITTGALFAGFYAVVAGMNGHYIDAALAIFVAMALDTADGRVARWTRSESDFGAEYDSLSDMVAFGIAPALVAFSWGAVSLGRVGWVATFVYAACAALRLARFNTQGSNDSFTGLASPSAAAIVACSVWVLTEAYNGSATGAPAMLLAGITAFVGLLMVSNFQYYSPKVFNLRGRVPFVTLVVIVLGLAIILLDPPRVLLAVFSIYALSGPVMALSRAWRRWRSASADSP